MGIWHFGRKCINSRTALWIQNCNAHNFKDLWKNKCKNHYTIKASSWKHFCSWSLSNRFGHASFIYLVLWRYILNKYRYMNVTTLKYILVYGYSIQFCSSLWLNGYYSYARSQCMKKVIIAKSVNVHLFLCMKVLQINTNELCNVLVHLT